MHSRTGAITDGQQYLLAERGRNIAPGEDARDGRAIVIVDDNEPITIGLDQSSHHAAVGPQTKVHEYPISIDLAPATRALDDHTLGRGRAKDLLDSVPQQHLDVRLLP